MPYTYLQADSPRAMVDLLNGVVRGDEITYRVAENGDRLLDGAIGSTLEFTNPSVTVTFTDPGDGELEVDEALTQINTQVQAVDANFIARLELAKDKAPGLINSNQTQPRLRFVFQTDTAAGVSVTGGTYRDQLGFQNNRAAEPTVSTDIVAGGDTMSGGLYIIIAP